jgi:hypothetical protein
MTRRDQILEIARNNALEGLDQGRVDDYEDNMHDTLTELFPDCTPAEAGLAEDEFNRIVKSN